MRNQGLLGERDFGGLDFLARVGSSIVISEGMTEEVLK